MFWPMNDREFRCSLGDLVEALYDEVDEIPLSDPAKVALVAIMLGDIMSQDGRAVFFQAPTVLKIHLDAA